MSKMNYHKSFIFILVCSINANISYVTVVSLLKSAYRYKLLKKEVLNNFLKVDQNYNVLDIVIFSVLISFETLVADQVCHGLFCWTQWVLLRVFKIHSPSNIGVIFEINTCTLLLLDDSCMNMIGSRPKCY